MRIVDERAVKDTVLFGALHAGDVFYHLDNPEEMQMKIYPITDEDENTFNAVNLSTGELDNWCGCDDVFIADAELVVRN